MIYLGKAQHKLHWEENRLTSTFLKGIPALSFTILSIVMQKKNTGYLQKSRQRMGLLREGNSASATLSPRECAV